MNEQTVIGLSDPDRKALFLEAQRNTGMVAEMIEKDFWVCWTLRHLFELPEAKDHFIFKGGTSLSKVWRVIQRFSEDIDISLSREWLGFLANEILNKQKENNASVYSLSFQRHVQRVCRAKSCHHYADQWSKNFSRFNSQKLKLVVF
jgi:predicted nucleotidyltransferase component of viral defense system